MQQWSYFLCIMQVAKEKSINASNCNFHHICFNFGVKLLTLGISKQTLYIIVALCSFQQAIQYTWIQGIWTTITIFCIHLGEDISENLLLR